MKSRGSTLLECLIFLVIIAIIACIAVPLLIKARIKENEKRAVTVLEEIRKAEDHFRGKTGRYGTLSDIFHAEKDRVVSSALHQWFDSTKVDPRGVACCRGYYLIVYLKGEGMTEEWCAYAWPFSYDSTGLRSYWIGPAGELRRFEESRDANPDRVPPRPSVAFIAEWQTTDGPR